MDEKYDFFGRNKLDKAEANKLLRDIRRWDNRDKIDLKYWNHSANTDKYVNSDGEEEYMSDQDDVIEG